jgi:hypothetical protein
MVFNATFNSILVILWRSILLVEEIGVPEENHRQTLSHNIVSSIPRHERNSNSQPLSKFILNLYVNNISGMFKKKNSTRLMHQ